MYGRWAGQPRRRRAGEFGGLALGWLILIASTAGAGIGAGLGAGGVDLVRDVRVLAADAVTFYDCPGGVGLGDFHRGDRVYATARIEGGGWIEVRSPLDPGTRVWVEVRYAIPDASTDDLPVVDCGGEELAPGEVTTTTAGAPGAEVTTTTAAGGGTTPGPTDTTAPTVGSISVSGTTIQREVGQSGCPTSQLANVSAAINDNVGVASVTISWSVGSKSGSVTQSHGAGTYSTQVGNFPFDTLPVSTTSGITVVFTAKDAAGNTGTQTFNNAAAFQLQSCG